MGLGRGCRLVKGLRGVDIGIHSVSWLVFKSWALVSKGYGVPGGKAFRS